MERIKKWFYKEVEKELAEYDKLSIDDRVISIIIIMFFPLIVSYFVAHQLFSTGFFITTFGILEMILLYGILGYWIFTCAVLLLELKDLSRDVDAFGGLIFAAISFAWLSIVFPFDFTYFADLLPVSLRFLVQWISNGIARVVLILGCIIHSILAVVAIIYRVMVRNALTKRKKVSE